MQQDPQVIRQSIEQALQESLSLQGGKMQTISPFWHKSLHTSAPWRSSLQKGLFIRPVIAVIPLP